MSTSFVRFLTTHTGSLPRPESLVRTMFAKEEGVAVDRVALGAQLKAAVAEVVRRQVDAGVDIVSDGEMSKPSYATYVKERLTGFGGTSQRLVYQDLVEFPEVATQVFGDPGRSRRRSPSCTGPIAVADAQAVQADVDNLREATRNIPIQGAFISAASPGVISLFFKDEYYHSEETYLAAIADVMRREYETVAAAGFILQVDCPDLAMGRHIQYAHLDLKEFRKRARLHVEALNDALVNVPTDRLRMHLCWGNYEGPHHCDVALKDIIDIVLLAKPRAISFEAANPRHAHEWTVFETTRLPDDKVLIPGVIDSKTNVVEHPELIAQRLCRYANLVGKEHVIAGSDCGFGTWVGQAAVDPQIVWMKLSAMAEGARLASQLV